MKAIYLLLLITLITLISCDQFNQTSAPVNKEVNSPNQLEFSVETPDVKQFEDLLAQHYNNNIKSKSPDRILASTIVVPDDYTTIQKAVDNASEGANIIVKEGFYDEEVVVTTKGLDIKAEGEVFLLGTFFVNAEDVTIRNFEIKVANINYFCGIICIYADGCTVKDNTVYNAFNVGIFIIYSDNCEVKNNTCNNRLYGISFSKCSNGSAKNNTCYNNSYQGITTSLSKNIEVKDNNCYKNGQAGILISQSYYCTVKDNNSSENRAGVAFQYSDYNNLIDNTTNSNSYRGIYLILESKYNMIKDNVALYNGICDIVNEGTDNTFINNTADCTIGF